jgi:hypothetical protein
MEYTTVPLRTETGHQQLGDDALVAIWGRLVAEGKVEQLFYFGGINSPEEFLAYIKATNLHVCVVVENATKQVRAIIWLTNISAGTAFAHYATFGGFSRGVGGAALDYWCGLRRPDGQPVLHVLLGITPEYHRDALRVIRIMGFTSLGTIPSYCRGQGGQGRCGAVLSHYECAKHRR